MFISKMQDYGVSWRVMRVSSLVDQIYIKVKRLRTIEEQGKQVVDDPVTDEYCGIVNYSLMALIQLSLGNFSEHDDPDFVLRQYDEQSRHCKELMVAKNHDYGEAWRWMNISSVTDLMLVKVLRIKQILDNEGRTLVSEGVDGNLRDILNYAVFALIKMEEKNHDAVV